MQNVPSEKLTDNPKIADKVCSTIATGSPPQSTTSNSSPAKSVETETYSEHRRYMSDSSESEDDSVSEVESFMIDQEFEDDNQTDNTAKFLLNPSEDRSVDPETQARLEQLLQVAGIGQLASKDGKHLGDPEVLRRLTSSVSCALDEAAAALTRMRSDNSRPSAAQAAVSSAQISASAALQAQSVTQQITEKTSLVEACTDGDVGTVRKLLTEGRSVHETSEEGESLLSLACSAGYFELAQVLLAMHANVEDRGIKGECTPLMEAASAGHLEIVKLLVSHGADVNAQSTSGNTPLMYACAGGHQDVVRYLLENGANVEDHNENGHTPLMEAASAGHVALARILLAHGAGINTHSNEFKESALTLACYKGHLDMVRFLLEAGADQEHKTDEMHTALMEASMDGHVEVARLLLDSGAQVNMPTDSFESPLTLAACGGHVDLAMLLIERGANIEEVNDEGYTPLMEAAREGHEEMVHLLLGQGANINAQTDETQETALTLACCGGFTEVADILLKGGADIELGASTPLMEASQEGHLELVRFLLENNANVHTQTQTGDTALTYACENGHTDVADLLLQYGADLEHESEGGRTPLMKACRAGHLCTVQFLISKGANVRRQTTNNDHTPLSLACAGGHLPVVELLLTHNADPGHKLKDNSTMLIEAAKGGHTNVVQLLLDYPHSMSAAQVGQIGATTLAMLPGQVGGTNRESPLPNQQQGAEGFFQPPSAILQEVPEAVRIVRQDDMVDDPPVDVGPRQMQTRTDGNTSAFVTRKTVLPKSRSAGTLFDGNLTSAEAQQVRTQPLKGPDENDGKVNKGTNFPNEVDIEEDDEVPQLDASALVTTGMHMLKNRSKQFNNGGHMSGDEGSTQKQQILEELHRVERDFHIQAHNHAFPYGISQEQCPSSVGTNPLPHMLNIDIAMSQQKQGLAAGLPLFPCNLQTAPNAFYNAAAGQTPKLVPVSEQQQQSSVATAAAVFAQHQQQQQNQQQSYYFAPLPVQVGAPSMGLSAPSGMQTNSVPHQPIKFHSVTSHAEVSQHTAISDRPKAKPVSKKEGKNIRKQQQQLQTLHQQQVLQQQAQQHAQQQQVQIFPHSGLQVFSHTQFQQNSQIQSQQFQPLRQQSDGKSPQEILNFQGLDLDSIESETLVLKNDNHDLLTASILQQFHSTPALRAAFIGGSPQKSRLELYDHGDDASKVTRLELSEKDFSTVDDVVQTLESLHNNEVQPSYSSLDESMIASLTVQQDLPTQADLSRVEYFAVPTNSAQVPVHTMYPYDHYLGAGLPKEQLFQAGFQAGYNLMQQQLSPGEAMNNSNIAQLATPGVPNQPQYVAGLPPQQQPICAVQQPPCNHVVPNNGLQQTPLHHHCQSSCAQHPQLPQTHHQATHQVQAATQTPQSTQTIPNEMKKARTNGDGIKMKKSRVMRHQNQIQQGGNFQGNPNYQIDHNAAITQYSGGNPQLPNAVISPVMDVDSETESNHDTALTLACAGGHDDLVELLISRGADIEHRDKKGFTPLILAATAGHEKVVETLLNHSADIEAQSERTKDTPLSLACSGGRYEVVELLLNRNANKEHRNVSDYTPLSLAASGGYVNIIKLLLSHGAEINSRTGSKLGISPLMLAAMNGHTAAVKLLLDMGSDINAQIETNRNTALTLACFQGRHEVVSLLLDRKANVEHRAKTGLTPLMEAASGGYVDVGRVLLDKGADVNATPVPSSRDTALTIAADKGHVRFVELLLVRGAQVEVKNKKGNSPLWLAANGGHLPVVELLYNVHADIDSQDNRKVSCLMAAFRKGHVKVVKWMVHHVTQFPSDQEMLRYNATINDKELLEKCQECVKIIRAAKETQAAKANKNASILLEELESEKTREESKRLAAARRRERKKKKKLEKKEERRKLLEENRKNENFDEKRFRKEYREEDEDEVPEPEPQKRSPNQNNLRNNNVDSNSTSANSSQLNEQLTYVNSHDKEECTSIENSSRNIGVVNESGKPKEKRKEKKKKKSAGSTNTVKNVDTPNSFRPASDKDDEEKESSKKKSLRLRRGIQLLSIASDEDVMDSDNKKNLNLRRGMVFEATKSPAEREDFEATGNEVYVSTKKANKSFEEPTFTSGKNSCSPKQQINKREEGWKEVVRKSSVQTLSTTETGMKRVSVPVPPSAISRVIGRGGSNINAIRGATGAHIEVEKQTNKQQTERFIFIKGSTEATKQAHNLIATLIKDPDVDILTMLPKTTNNKTSTSATTLWDKTQIGTKKNTGKVVTATQVSNIMVFSATTGAPKTTQAVISSNTSTTGGRFTVTNNSSTVTKPRASSASATPTPRSTITKTAAQPDKTINNSNHVSDGSSSTSVPSMTISHHTVSNMAISSTTSSKISTSTIGQTFAAKLTETTSSSHISANNKIHPSMSLKAKTTIASSHMQIPVSSQQMHLMNSADQISPPLSHHNQGWDGMTSTIINSDLHSSPNRSEARPHSTPSASPNIHQHFQNLGKISPMFGASDSNQSTASNKMTENVMNSLRSSTPNLIPNNPQLLHVDEPTHLTAPPEYNLFSAGGADHWNRCTTNDQHDHPHHHDIQSAKPINFAAVTGGVAGSSTVVSSAQSVNSAYSGGPHAGKFVEHEVPKQFDLSKAPGYRGGAVCSPVSSKASSSSNTPPNIAGNGTYPVYQDPGTQNSVSPNGNSVVNRPEVSQENPGYFGEFMKAGTNIPSMLNLSGESHLMQSNYNTIQGLNIAQQQPSMNMQPHNTSMSRLNPKAPEYSYGMQSKTSPSGVPSQQPMYNNGYQAMGNVYLSKQVGDGYHQRGGMGSMQQNRMWMTMPPSYNAQTESLMSGMAGLTLHNIAAKFTGNEVLENGDLAGMVAAAGSSPNLSPNLQPNLPANLLLHQASTSEGPAVYGGLEERKPPQPIGTGRKSAYVSTNPLESWRSGVDKNDGGWSISNGADYALRDVHNHLIAADEIADAYRQMPLEPQHFMNGQPYFNQPPISTARSDFMKALPKLDIMWDNASQPMQELPEKQHGWTNKWNQ